jgi:hypothetical protein
METFHPILYSVLAGAANGQTVQADNADEACRKAAAGLWNLSVPEVDRMIERYEIEVIAVIKGDPKFAMTENMPLFPG